MKALPESADMDVRQNEQPKHRHAGAELYVSLDGRATHMINGKESETLPLDVFVLTRDMTHGQLEARRYRYCIFKFDLEVLRLQAKNLLAEPAFQSLFIIEPQLRRQGLLDTNLQIDPLTAEYAAKTAQLLTRETDRTLCDTLFFALVSVICKNARPRSRQCSSYGLIAEAASYMETHYGEALDLEQLAAQTHYSKRHFTRLFKDFYQQSPMDYVNHVRLRHAVDMLSVPGMNLSGIAEACGFADGGLFSKHFRRHFGLSPSAYQKKSRPASQRRNILRGAVIIEPEASRY